MNTKTTLLLALMLVALGAVYYAVLSKPQAVVEEDSAPSYGAASSVTRDLIEEKLADIVKVECRRQDGPRLVFEKGAPDSGGTAVDWAMTAPLQMKCVRWELDKFGNQIGRAKYDLSYGPGEAGAVTPAQAGLEPATATITLTDSEEETLTVEIGGVAPNRGTYVRLADSDRIYLVSTDLRGLVKKRAIEYRDQQVWSFAPGDVTRVELDDRTDRSAPVSYVLSKDGDRWMMEQPVTARATSKVDDMLQSMSRIRAAKWQDDDADKAAMYGLSPAALTVRATIVETVPVEKAEDFEEESAAQDSDATAGDQPVETQEKTTVYVLHLSDQTPIGEDTTTYFRVGDENAVATVSKTVSDKFKPVMSEWRDMRITSASAADARRIALSTPTGSVILAKGGGTWSFEGDGGLAEPSAVSTLLGAIENLSAVVFLDDATVDLAAYGLATPRMRIELTLPDQEGPERIAIGDYTDQQTKRLVYVRRNEAASIGKVKATELVELMKGTHAYRDRTIIEELPSQFEKISLSTENALAGGRMEIALERTGQSWSMVEPVKAPIRDDQKDKLVELLGALRAQQVVAEQGESSAYGLHSPQAVVTLSYKPPVEHRLEESTDRPEGENAEAAPSVTPVEYQPPSETIELSVAQHDGKYYAKRADRPTIYEVDAGLYRQLLVEYRNDRVMDFKPESAQRFSIRNGDQTHVFVKKDSGWVYEIEPDIPLDASKVDNLVLQIRDLRTPRRVAYGVDNLASFGLDAPAHEVVVTMDDGSALTLEVSSQSGGIGAERGAYAQLAGTGNPFVLAPDSLARITVSLDELE